MGFLRTLIIIILIYYIWRFIFRYIILPLYQGYTTGAKNHNSQPFRRTGKEGETIINYKPDKKKIIDKDKGEYVDYEDIKD